MHNETTPFRLFANCIKVKGITRSTICDLQREKIHLIPNSLFDVLEKYEGRTFAEVKADFVYQYDEIIDEYISFLVKEDLIVFSDQLSSFPELSMEYSSPADITNCIIDFDSQTQLDIKMVIDQLDELNCSFLQLRFYSEFDLQFYQALIDAAEGSTVTSIELVLPYSKSYSLDDLMAFCDKNARITAVLVHGASQPEDLNSPQYAVRIRFIVQSIIDQTCCGIISQQNFVLNQQTFLESQHFNTCLNSKISIDVKGWIRNCPSMKDAFGNINETTLPDALGREGFKKVWNVSKDQIDTCKDCEFRHVCTDCRAYLENPQDPLSRPLKCGYNPRTCEWENWSKHPMKQQAIEYYEIKDII